MDEVVVTGTRTSSTSNGPVSIPVFGDPVMMLAQSLADDNIANLFESDSFGPLFDINQFEEGDVIATAENPDGGASDVRLVDEINSDLDSDSIEAAENELATKLSDLYFTVFAVEWNQDDSVWEARISDVFF